MNWLDAVLIIALVVSVLGGLRNGLIGSLIPFAGLILGIYLALHFYIAFGRVMPFLPQPDTAKWVAFAIILVLTMLFSYFVARLLRIAVSSFALGWLDHALGGVWGLVFGALFIAALLTIWLQLVGESSVISGSPVARFLVGRFDSILKVLPGEFQAVRDFFEHGIQTISG